jgi:uncharacterized membrane protein YgdD (TMEM256/DUF423 family)
MQNHKKLLIAGTIFCLTSVILGALGAHALREHLSTNQLTSFESGVRFQMYHGIVLLIIPSIKLLNDAVKNILFYFITIGTCLFSFSIYLLCTAQLFNTSMNYLGPVTPIGGTLLIVAWFIILWKIISYKSTDN